jgi:hypothetical protein
MKEAININWGRMNADGFYLGRTPKKLLFFIENALKENKDELHLTHIDLNEYHIFFYQDAIKVKFVNSCCVVKLWFIIPTDIKKCWKEIS